MPLKSATHGKMQKIMILNIFNRVVIIFTKMCIESNWQCNCRSWFI